MKAFFVVAAVALVAAAWDDRDDCAVVKNVDGIHDADLTLFGGVRGILIQGGASLLYFSLCQEVSNSQKTPLSASILEWDPTRGALAS